MNETIEENTPSSRFLFTSLTIVVLIAGLSQGLTLPLLAILLEEQGVSSVANGLNAAALYIGILLVSPWWEYPLRRFGYRSLIIFGMCLVIATTVLLPFFHNLWIWFALRFLLGIGDSALHYSSQIWITAKSPAEQRGRNISLYGLAYGVGFSIGPLAIFLLPFGRWVPFLMVSLFYLVSFTMIFRLKNEFPEQVTAVSSRNKNKYMTVVSLSWLALIPAFLYGYIEASLNGSFPIYALRTNITIEWVSLILPSFVVGSLILQLPLGTLSDRVGRKKVMITCAVIGTIAFSLLPLVGNHVWLIMLLLVIAGAVVGSFYSLGLAFSADLLPASLVPTAGIITGVNFSVGSIVAPNLNGFLIEYVSPGTMFIFIGVMLGLFTIAGLFFSERKAEQFRKLNRAHESASN